MIPVTILTGFLGAGKTTILNKIISENPDRKFGLIINEFGEEGVDGQLIKSTSEEMVEMSNGCICCVVRKDLQDAAMQLVNSGKVDYIIIETSGLAEPMPVAQTFINDDFDGKVGLDSIVCLVDAQNYIIGLEEYKVGAEQLGAADIVVLNKLTNEPTEEEKEAREAIKQINPYASILENRDEQLDTKLLIETGKWTVQRLLEQDSQLPSSNSHKHDAHDDHHKQHDHNEHDHETPSAHGVSNESTPHHHEHEDVDEVLFISNEPIDVNKLNDWMLTKLPKSVVRAKGFIKMQMFPGQYGTFLLQMVGASRMIMPFSPQRENFNADISRIVFIGKDLPKQEMLETLKEVREMN